VLSSPCLVAISFLRATYCQPFPPKVSVKTVPRHIPDVHPLLVLPLPNQIHMFTKDLERLAADLEASDDRAAVVQQYKDRFVVKSKVRRGLGHILVLSCSHSRSLRMS